tara:strand:- start:1176 stop:1454 length:279 start_codon:yes stop_codon:yes gene_type:complete
MEDGALSVREWLTVPEWMDRHPHIGKGKVYESVRNGTLLSIRLGTKILVASDALDVLAGKSLRAIEKKTAESSLLHHLGDTTEIKSVSKKAH